MRLKGTRMAQPWRHPKTQIFYFRKTVPAPLRAAIGFTEFKVSLGSHILSDTVRQQFHHHAIEAEKVLADARRRHAGQASSAAQDMINGWLVATFKDIDPILDDTFLLYESFLDSLRRHLAESYTQWWLGMNDPGEMELRQRELDWREVPGFCGADQNRQIYQHPGLLGTFAMHADFSAIAAMGNPDAVAEIEDEDGSHIAPEWLCDYATQEECGRILVRAMLKKRYYKPISKIVASIFVCSLQTFEYGDPLHSSICVRLLNHLAAYQDDSVKCEAEIRRAYAWPKGLPFDITHEYVGLSTLLKNAKKLAPYSSRQSSKSLPLDVAPAPNLQPTAKLVTRGSFDQTCISNVFEKWKAHYKPEKSLESEWRLALNRFIALHGDLPVAEITSSHIRSYRDMLAKLPSRPNFAIRALPLQAQADRAAQDGLQTLSIASVNKAMTGIRVILEHAVDELELLIENPARIVKALPRKSRTRNSYKSFEEAELLTIFESIDITNFKAADQFDLAGHMPVKDYLYWMCHLGLYTGCRMEELGQLRIKDVRQERGIWFVDICDEPGETTVKTENAVRQVPIHSQLIKLDFLDFVESRRGKDDLLFYDMPGVKNEKRTKEFSRIFGRHLDQLGIVSKQKVFHSFRHTFKSACRAAKIQNPIQHDLMGHSKAGMDGIYGDCHPLQVQQEAINTISYNVDKL